MGCGTSRATEVNPSTLPGGGPKPQEYSPDTKPGDQGASGRKRDEESSRDQANGAAAGGSAQAKGPLKVAAVPNLPPPPSTPPTAGIVQPLFGTSPQGQEGNDDDDLGYYPQQVALNVGGGAGGSGGASVAAPQPRSALPPPPQQPAPAPAQRLPSLAAPAQSASAGRAPQPEPQPAASSSAAAPDPNDPWSSLQSAYRIKGDARDDAAEGGGPRGHSRGSGSARSRRGGGVAPDAGAPREMLVLGDDDPFARENAKQALAGTARRGAGLPPPAARPAGQPKQGGWGGDDLAQAGTLMVGDDDWLGQDGPGQQGGGYGGLQGQLPGGDFGRQRSEAERSVGRAPVAKSRPVNDVVEEDIEDVDSLLEDELQRQGLSDKNLAAKMAAFEAQFRDDD